jgi:NTE family protein
VRLFRKAPKVNLALQGGGAHGAFTWGVLDRLLEEDGLEIGWISGTSAGAVNAVALAGGLAEGGPQHAREKLRQVWQAVYQAGVPDLMRLNPFLYGLTRASFGQMAGLMSPYEFNPLGFDPLRRLLEQTIDFALIRRAPPVGLLIAATEVATGRPRLFRAHELSVESVLASACLPTLHRAVEIEGKAYWDGGFSANPDLVTLACESPIADTLLVMINPVIRHELPTGSREISGHVNHITFNAPLRRDVELIETLRRESGRSWWNRKSLSGRLDRHRFHLVEAGRYTASLKHETKMKPDWGLFTYLHGAGRTETHKWLDRHRADIGRRETARLAESILGDGHSATPATTDHANIASDLPGGALTRA